MNERTTRLLLIAAIALAGPMALGLDLVARQFVLQGQPEDLRDFMSDHVTRVAWYFVPLPLIGGALGFFRYPTMLRRSVERLGPTATRQALETAELKTLFLATTMAQLPALLGDLSVMLGARLTPALCTTSLSVALVLAIGVRSLRRARPVESGRQDAPGRAR